MLTEDHFISGAKKNAMITTYVIALECVHFDSKTVTFFLGFKMTVY